MDNIIVLVDGKLNMGYFTTFGAILQHHKIMVICILLFMVSESHSDFFTF